MKWQSPAQQRSQLLLMPRSLDDAIPDDHVVRVVDEILRSLDWSAFTAHYSERRGQPAIHPRVLAGVILYGHLVRIRSSRRLEEALEVRLDFQWLAEGRRIDHTTLSEFRRRFGEELVSVGAQMAVIAHRMGVTTLSRVFFDGTRVRANNGRHRSVSSKELRELERACRERLAELEREVQSQEGTDGEASSTRVSQELAEVRNRLAALERAREELKRAQEAEEAIPDRIPLTDPESRITPNKSGGFAPNYTPTAAVDAESGLILNEQVVAHTEEERVLLPSLDQIEDRLAAEGQATRIEEVTADGKFSTGPVLEELSDRGTELCSPIPGRPPCVDREDGREPIPEAHWDELPTRRIKKAKKGEPARVQLKKEAFLYDGEENCYWCPLGEKLSYLGRTSERIATKGKSRRVQRYRYGASESSCASCPLRDRCVSPGAKRRTLSHDQYEKHRESHRERMGSAERQERLKERQTEGERPFAVIKHRMGVRQFLLRGLPGVQTEWRWATTAYNVDRLVAIIRRLGRDVWRGAVKGLRANSTRGSPEPAPARA